MLAVPHAAAAGTGVDGFGPLAGGRRQRRDRLHQLEATCVIGAQQHLCDMQGQVGVDAGVDHILKEPGIDEALVQQELHRVQQPRIIRLPQLERIARHDGADRAGIQPAVGRGRHGNAAEAFGHLRKTAIDSLLKCRGLAQELLAQRCLAHALAQRRSRAQAGDSPEVIPVVVVVGSEVLRAETRRQQPRVHAGGVLRQPLAPDPASPAHDGLVPPRRGRTPGELAKAVHDPQRFAVGVPLPFLGVKIASGRLA